MGVFKLCTRLYSNSKHEIAPSTRSVSTLSSNNLHNRRFSRVSKPLGFQSCFETPPMGIISSTLPCVKTSRNLLWYGFGQKLHNPLSDFAGKRHYSVSRNLILQPIVKCLSCITFFTGRFVKVPFTNQTLYVFPFVDKIWGEYYFQSVKDQCKQGLVLSQNHPDCVRVEAIAMKLLKALELQTGRRQMLANQQWLKDDDGEVKLVKNSRRKDDVKSRTAYLEEEIDWEVFVLDLPYANAGYINIGKILVFKGLFHEYKTDDELAVMVGNQIGHVAARHAQRSLIWFPFKLYHRVIHGSDPDVYYYLRHEQEADLIGMFLSAHAGYDPRAVPKALEKNKRDFAKSNVSVFLMDERVKFLTMPGVMDVAVSVYEKGKKGGD